MTPERWQAVKTVLAEALARSPEEREGFLATTCATDPSMRREVESLLRSAEGTDGFLEPPLATDLSLAEVPGPHGGPDLAARLQAALAGRYTLGRELGRGGMATVYLAGDLKHDRPVALKVMHPELARSLGPERFLREIRLYARLQHPHILPIHDSGESNEQLWYTMPFIEGESLRERLRRDA